MIEKSVEVNVDNLCWAQDATHSDFVKIDRLENCFYKNSNASTKDDLFYWDHK